MKHMPCHVKWTTKPCTLQQQQALPTRPVAELRAGAAQCRSVAFFQSIKSKLAVLHEKLRKSLAKPDPAQDCF